MLIRLAWDGFDPSTQGVKSRALPEIYAQPAKFKAAQETMFTEMNKFVAAAKSGNEANTKAAIGDVLKACNGCHDTFRQKANSDSRRSGPGGRPAGAGMARVRAPAAGMRGKWKRRGRR